MLQYPVISLFSLALRNFWLAKRMNIVCNHVPVCSLAVDLRGSGALSPLQFYPRSVTKAAALLVSFSALFLRHLISCLKNTLRPYWRGYSNLERGSSKKLEKNIMRNHPSPLPLPWLWATIFLATAYIIQPVGHITYLDPEAGDNIILRNAGICLQDQWCQVEFETVEGQTCFHSARMGVDRARIGGSLFDKVEAGELFSQNLVCRFSDWWDGVEHRASTRPDIGIR